MLNNLIKSILLGALVIGSISATELKIKVRKVSHPDFEISHDGSFIEKN